MMAAALQALPCKHNGCGHSLRQSQSFGADSPLAKAAAMAMATSPVSRAGRAFSRPEHGRHGETCGVGSAGTAVRGSQPGSKRA